MNSHYGDEKLRAAQSNCSPQSQSREARYMIKSFNLQTTANAANSPIEIQSWHQTALDGALLKLSIAQLRVRVARTIEREGSSALQAIDDVA